MIKVRLLLCLKKVQIVKVAKTKNPNCNAN